MSTYINQVNPNCTAEYSIIKKTIIPAASIGIIVAAILLVLSAIQICGPIGSTGFIASTSLGIVLILPSIAALVWLVLKKIVNDSHCIASNQTANPAKNNVPSTAQQSTINPINTSLKSPQSTKASLSQKNSTQKAANKPVIPPKQTRNPPLQKTQVLQNTGNPSINASSNIDSKSVQKKAPSPEQKKALFRAIKSKNAAEVHKLIDMGIDLDEFIANPKHAAGSSNPY